MDQHAATSKDPRQALLSLSEFGRSLYKDDMSDAITKNPYSEVVGISFFAFHGAYPEEKENGQTFTVDVALFGDFANRAEISDDLNETVDYAAVCRTIIEIGTTTRVDLLERLGAMMADELIANFPVSAVTVSVSKQPPAGVPGDPKRFTVRVRRSRPRLLE